MRRQDYSDFTSVSCIVFAKDQAILVQPFHQFGCAVRLQEETVGQIADEHAPIPCSSDCQKSLVLLRRKSSLARGLLGEAQEAAKLVTEPCQSGIIFLIDLVGHKCCLDIYRVTT